MSHYTEGSFKTYQVGATALAAGVAVKLSSGLLVAAAAATDPIIGVVERAAAAGSVVDVHLRSAAGTISILAGASITAGAAITSNSAGEGIATTTANDQIIGIALEGAADGAFCELLPSTGKY